MAPFKFQTPGKCHVLYLFVFHMVFSRRVVNHMVDNQQLWWIFSISVVVNDNREIGCYKYVVKLACREIIGTFETEAFISAMTES